MSPDPRAHEAHDLPLAWRIIDSAITAWLDTATGIAQATSGSPPLNDYERGMREGVEQMRYLHLANSSYTVTLVIADQLHRAGLLQDMP